MLKHNVDWGVVGASGWAARRFAPAVAAASHARLTAILSRDIKRAEKLASQFANVKAFNSMHEFLDDETVEAVWVASPTFCHAEHSITALRAGKHVLCEKPMALNSKQCRAMIQSSQTSKRLLGIGYVMRHHPILQTLRETWLRGEFGTPVTVHARFLYAFQNPPVSWKQMMSTSGGWATNDIATHLIDLVCWLLGQPLEGYAFRSSPFFHFETDDYLSMIVCFSEGKIAHIESSTGVSPVGPCLELIGSDGYAILEGTLLGGEGKLITQRRGNPLTTESISEINLYRLQVEAFSQAIKNGTSFHPSADDGLATVAIIEQIHVNNRLLPLLFPKE